MCEFDELPLLAGFRLSKMDSTNRRHAKIDARKRSNNGPEVRFLEEQLGYDGQRDALARTKVLETSLSTVVVRSEVNNFE